MTTHIKPYVLSSHTRPLTRVIYNRDGDLLLTASKDGFVYVWASDTGEMMGSYSGHTGAVTDIDVDPSSSVVLSGSGDLSAHLWSLTTGRTIRRFTSESPVSSVAIAPDARHALLVVGGKMGKVSSVLVIPIHDVDLSASQSATTTSSACAPTAIIFPAPEHSHAVIARWGPNDTVYMGHENGTVTAWDSATQSLLYSCREFSKSITDLHFSPDMSHFVVSSKDTSARIMSLDMQTISSFKTERPINAAVICPLRPHVILGGGQDAERVTGTSIASGKFESRFFHAVLGQEFGRIKGHFGPINAIAVHPYNQSFATGGEDGNVRLHILPKSYFNFKLDPLDFDK